jgi:hypothetical protein
MDLRHGAALDLMSQQQLARHVGRCARELQSAATYGLPTRRRERLLAEIAFCGDRLIQTMAQDVAARLPQHETLFDVSTAYPVDL